MADNENAGSAMPAEIAAMSFEQALAELQELGAPLVRAFMMRRKRLLKDGEFVGLRIVAEAKSRMAADGIPVRR